MKNFLIGLLTVVTVLFVMGIDGRDVVSFVKRAGTGCISDSLDINGTQPATDAASDVFDGTAEKEGGDAETRVGVIEYDSKTNEVETKSELEPYSEDDLEETYAKEGDGPLKAGYKIYFSDCLLVPYKVESTKKYGLCINSDILHFAFDPIYDDIYIENFAKSGMVLLKKDGKWGALNYDTFEFTVPFRFDIIKPYRDGKANAVLNGKSVVIDTKGNIVG